MTDIFGALEMITAAMSGELSANGFETVLPEGYKKGDFPAQEINGKTVMTYSSKKGAARIEYNDQKISLFLSDKILDESADADFRAVSVSLMDLETFDEKDFKSIGNEFAESIREEYKAGAVRRGNGKLPQPVSKSAAKAGSAYYDMNTLGARLSVMFPELRPMYKENLEKYGEFLAEEFFDLYGTPAIMQTIRENNTQRMKKLFHLLNEIYNDGTNETQSLIVVSILGRMYDDEQLLANCVDYMEDMMLPVIETNKYFRTASGKVSLKKMENPPPYKPKKKKKSSFMDTLMGGGQNLQQ